jgi:hypothetical protein
MAVGNNTASLIVYSPTQPAAAVTEALGVEPTSSHEKGNRMATGGPAVAAGSGPTRFRESLWQYSVVVQVDSWEQDPAGTASLRQLLEVFAGKATQFASLRPQYETHISWSGHSGSAQGGFVIEPELLTALAELGCRFFGDVYLTAEP